MVDESYLTASQQKNLDPFTHKANKIPVKIRFGMPLSLCQNGEWQFHTPKNLLSARYNNEKM